MYNNNFVSSFLSLAFVFLFSSQGAFALEGGDGKFSYDKLKNKPFTETILPFNTDGCTNFFDGTSSDKNKSWRHCCVEHDLVYWSGGPADLRKEADLELKKCVAEKGGPIVAQAMYSAVRLFGGPYTGHFFRWGFGWDYLVGYDELTPEQQESVDEELEKYLEDLD